MKIAYTDLGELFPLTLCRWIAAYGRRNETIIVSKGGHPLLEAMKVFQI